MLPLEGYRVIDLTHVLAGPCATHHVRCLGAEVIKVERPGSGDAMRDLAMQPELEGLAPGFRAFKPGKKSVVVDLGGSARAGRGPPGGPCRRPEGAVSRYPTSERRGRVSLRAATVAACPSA